MTALEQRFLETLPSELRKLNETLSKMLTLSENNKADSIEFQDSILSDTKIKTASLAAGFLRSNLSGLDHEEVWIILLGNDLRPHQKYMLCSGSLTSTIIDVRRIVKDALFSNANAVIIAHNHPSGDCEPSSHDIESTEKLKAALDYFDISLVDHIIISGDEYYSFAMENTNSFTKQ